MRRVYALKREPHFRNVLSQIIFSHHKYDDFGWDNQRPIEMKMQHAIIVIKWKSISWEGQHAICTTFTVALTLGTLVNRHLTNP